MKKGTQMQALRRLSLAVAAGMLALATPALAQAPRPWQMGFQDAHSPVMHRLVTLNTMITIIIVLITAFVAGLLGYALWRFQRSRNPTPSRVSHNTVIEIAWTVVPVLILVLIAIPSFRLVYYEDRTPNPDMTIKVTGHQWYWEYTYPDQGEINFTSSVVPDDQLKEGQIRLLSVDNALVLPVGKNIRILTNSGDVIHSFFIPSLGVQRYAIPGRAIETWVNIDQPGVYYGQCNQICGTNHSAMPIEVHAMTEADFNAWVAKTKSADAGGRDGGRFASAAPQR